MEGIGKGTDKDSKILLTILKQILNIYMIYIISCVSVHMYTCIHMLLYVYMYS